MKKNRWICWIAVIVMTAGLAGCGNQNGAVYVQSVTALAQMGGIAPGDLFAGMVVSENVTEITRDEDKTIAEILVREGDDVKEGDPLFSYDTEQLQLTLEKQELQLQQLQTTIENYEEQIFEMQKEEARSSGRDKLQYSIQIQTTQIDWKEALINQKTKQTEVEKSRNLLENATITSPVTGRIQSVNEGGGTDNNGKPLPFISIQQAGSYRIKGTINELQRGGIMEGDRLRVLSRTDDSAVWFATVTLVDYENPAQGNSNDMMMGMSSDEMTSSSKYPFYAELDSMEGLLLGQHVYLSLDTGEEETTGLSLGGAFICYEEDGSTYVWADNGRGKLEKRAVSLGDYNDMRDTYQILEGLTGEDFVAFPEEGCKEGAPTTKELPKAEVGEEDISSNEVQPMSAEGGV